MAASASSAKGPAGRGRSLSSNGGRRATTARIGKYEVEAEIGHSSIVGVFRAFDRDIGRPVMLKVLTDVADRSLIERFRREVAMAANLRSRSVIAIYEAGEHVGLPFAAMQHLGDDNLREAIQSRRPIPLLQKMRVMWQVAEGLQAAYRGGLPYVGLRPSGIALDSEGTATIQDFGIVRLSGEAEEDRRYTAPEELSSHILPDAICDIFAFGTIYFEVLTGVHPFLAGNTAERKIDIVRHEPARLRDLAPDCPEALERLVYRALEKQRVLRYQSIDDLQYDAEPILRELKRARAVALLAEARESISAENPEGAQRIVREVLELDPDNRKAQRLRTDLHDRLQSRMIQPRISTLLREAEEEAAGRRFGRATEILKSALRLDDANAEAKGLLEKVNILREQSQRCAQLLIDARQLFEAESLMEARSKALEALQVDPANSEAAEFLEAIGVAIERRDKQTRIEEDLAKAKSLLLSQSFDSAISILMELRAEAPDSPVIEHWLAHVQAQKAETERTAAAVGQVLEEVEWLLTQDRPDLAVQFLSDKTAEFPDEPNLSSRLESIEKRLPEWEKLRFLRDTLNQVTGLEQAQQWSVALTLLEEALDVCPAAGELLEAAERIKDRLRNQERRKKLTRRVELIGQKITAQAWLQAFSLIEASQAEFPDAAELQPLLEEVRRGQRRAECDGIVAEIRQCMADGETEQAEEILRKGLAALQREPALETLRDELEADKKYRDELRTAQIHFGRRQFEQSEQILIRLAAQKHAEAAALLETVREARAASEEHQFYNRGREKASKLIQEEKFDQAADLLRNLLTLFPGDAILERDLQSIGPASAQDLVPIAPAGSADIGELATIEVEKPEVPARPVLVAYVKPDFRAAAPRRLRSVEIAAVGALLVLVSASAAVWKFSRNESPAKTPAVVAAKSAQWPATVTAVAQPGAQSQTPAPTRVLSAEPEPSDGVKVASEEEKPQTKAAAQKPKPFHPPATVRSDAGRTVAALGAPPPSTIVFVSDRDVAGLPSVVAPLNAAAPAPSAVAPIKTQSTPPEVNVPPPPRPGGNFKEPKLISRVSPVMPSLAKARGMYGAVKLEAKVDKKGVVTNVNVLSGNPILAAAAKIAILSWRYEPATLNGQATDVQVQIQVVFEQGQR